MTVDPRKSRVRRNDEVDRSPAEAWTLHEHIADAISNEAQKLVNMAGSVELAKEALESTVEPLSTSQKQELAKQLGYESFDDLLAASNVMTLSDGSTWCLTADRSGAWLVWNVYAVDIAQRFDSKDEALAMMRQPRDLG